jgi:hypothetical protein
VLDGALRIAHALEQAGIVATTRPARGRRLRNIELPDLVGEMTAAIERYRRPSCRTTSVRLVHACAPISVRPANPLALLEHKEKHQCATAENECPRLARGHS